MQYIKSFRSILLSPKTVMTLIILMGISCLLGVSIPQVTEKSPHFFENWKLKSPVVYYLVDLLQLSRVYTSSWFLILVAFAALSLSWFVFEQLKLLVRSGRSRNRPVSFEAFKNYSEIQVDANPHAPDLSSRIKSIIRRKGYRLSYTDKENNILSFCKNKVGRWGTFLFHLGLLFIIFAALYALAFQKRGFVPYVKSPALVKIYKADGTLLNTFSAFDNVRQSVAVSAGELGY